MNLFRHLLFTFLFVFYFSLSAPAIAEKVNVAVASNFNRPMSEIVEKFEASHLHRVVLSFGSSGKIYAQIRNGAPFDIFLSADQEKPETLVKAGLALEDSQFTYAVGQLALWSADDARFKDGRKFLASQQYNKLAIANPKLAPYGLAAKQVLENLGLYNDIETQLIFGENISQTYQFVASRNADIGIVSTSQIRNQNTRGSIWLIPDALYLPIRQDAVLMLRGQNNRAAKSLLDFLAQEETKVILNRFGYKTDSY